MIEFILSCLSSSICTSFPLITCQLTISKVSNKNSLIANSWWVKMVSSESLSVLTNKTASSQTLIVFPNWWKVTSHFSSQTNLNKNAKWFSAHSNNPNMQLEELLPLKPSFYTRDLKHLPSLLTPSSHISEVWDSQQDLLTLKLNSIQTLSWPKKENH